MNATDLNAYFQQLQQEQKIAAILTIGWLVLIAVCSVFSCLMLWQILRRLPKKQDENPFDTDSIIYGSVSNREHEKLKDLKETQLKKDTQSQAYHQAYEAPQYAPTADSKYLPKS